MSDIDGADDVKQETANAVIESDDIDNDDVELGEPMSVSEFAEMMQAMQDKFEGESDE